MPKGVYVRKPRPITPFRLRTLRDDEAAPASKARRYVGKDGYVTLRWKVGIRQYVERREHRQVLDAPDAKHVHHRNHNRSDNRPENLVAVSAQEHAAIHSRERQRWDRQRAAQLYGAGLSTTEIARIYGVHASTISIGLRAAGVTMRPFASSPRVYVDEVAAVTLHDAGVRWDAIARKLGVSRMVVERVMRDNGRQPFRPGRPLRT